MIGNSIFYKNRYDHFRRRIYRYGDIRVNVHLHLADILA